MSIIVKFWMCCGFIFVCDEPKLGCAEASFFCQMGCWILIHLYGCIAIKDVLKLSWSCRILNVKGPPSCRRPVNGSSIWFLSKVFHLIHVKRSSIWELRFALVNLRLRFAFDSCQRSSIWFMWKRHFFLKNSIQIHVKKNWFLTSE
jgi:hypothetical protein